MFGNQDGFEDVYDEDGMMMVGDEFDGVMPDIDAGDFDETYVDPSLYDSAPTRPTGVSLPGSAAAATAAPGASFSAPSYNNQNGPQLGAAFTSKTGGFWLTLGPESLMTLIEAANRALQEIQGMRERGTQPAKFATAISMNLIPNPNYRPDNPKPGPLGFVYLANRGAMKEEPSAQKPTSQVNDPTMTAAMGIIAGAAPVMALPPRMAMPTTTASATNAVATPVIQNEGCLINLG